MVREAIGYVTNATGGNECPLPKIVNADATKRQRIWKSDETITTPTINDCAMC